MNDSRATIQHLKNTVRTFVEERDWQQFHSPKNLSIDLVSEATELLDLFLWCDNQESYDILNQRQQEVTHEIADTSITILAFCVRYSIDLTNAIITTLPSDNHAYYTGATHMNDSITTIQNLKDTVQQFVEERDWQQFHNPKNLSMSLVSEATEVLDLFLWCDNKESYTILEERRQEVEHEIADTAIVLLSFCIRHNIDLAQAIATKQKEAAAKYPVEKCKGKYTKYTEL